MGDSKFPILEQELGKCLSVEEVAEFLCLNPKTVLKDPRKYGGVRTAPRGKWFFFERNVVKIYGIQRQAEGEGWAEENILRAGENSGNARRNPILREEEGCQRLGRRSEKEIKKRLLREDRFGIYGDDPQSGDRRQ